MKILKKILIVLVAIIALIAIVGLFLPSEVNLVRITVINASPNSVYQEISSLKRSNKWSPWFRIDPEGTSYTYSGPDEGVGNKMEWSSEHPDVGTGSQEIVEAIPDQKIRTELYFGGFDEPSYADFTLEKAEAGTKVSWTFEGDMGGNPINRIFGLMMESLLGPTYEEGLANLKERVEAKPIFNVEIKEVDIEPINYLAVRESFDMANPETIGPRMGEIYGQLSEYINNEGVMGAGTPMSVYIQNSETVWEADIAIPVAETGEVSDESIMAGQTAGGKAVMGIHMGDYFDLNNTHNQILAYMKFNGLEANGQGYEIYVSDPAEPDTAKWRTDIYYPIK